MDDEDRKLLAWLRGELDDNDDQPNAAVRGHLHERDAHPLETRPRERQEQLRSLAMNYKERDAVLRPRRSGRRTLSRKEREIQRRRYLYYIEQRVHLSETEHHPDQVVATWINMTDFDLDLALSWWDAGVRPDELALITELHKHGLKPAHLAADVVGKPLIEHLRRGSSVKWCVLAAGWKERKNQSIADKEVG